MEDQATKIREYLNNFIPQLKDFVKSETIFGEPMKVEEITIILCIQSKGRSIRNYRHCQKSIRWFCRDFCLWRCFKTGSIQEMVL